MLSPVSQPRLWMKLQRKDGWNHGWKAGEEGEIQDGTRVFWRFSRCDKSNIENHIEKLRVGWAP